MNVNINMKLSGEIDKILERMVSAGAKITIQPDDIFWCARYAKI